MKISKAQRLIDYTKKTYDTIASDFSETRKNLWKDFSYFTPILANSQSVLDVGCGNGRAVELLPGAGISYLGIDNSSGLISQAKKTYGDRAETEFRVGDITDSSFETAQYDTAFMFAVLHHIPSQELRVQVVRNVYTALKPGGHLLMTNWNLWQPRYRKYIVSTGFQKIFKPSKSVGNVRLKYLDFGDAFIPWKRGGVLQQRYVHAFTISQLRAILGEAGFIVKQMEYSKQGKKAHIWNATNIITIAQKPNDE